MWVNTRTQFSNHKCIRCLREEAKEHKTKQNMEQDTSHALHSYLISSPLAHLARAFSRAKYQVSQLFAPRPRSGYSSSRVVTKTNRLTGLHRSIAQHVSTSTQKTSSVTSALRPDSCIAVAQLSMGLAYPGQVVLASGGHRERGRDVLPVDVLLVFHAKRFSQLGKVPSLFVCAS